MYRRNQISEIKYYSALFILAGIAFSLVLPTQSKISAAPDQTVAQKPAEPAKHGRRPLLFEANKGQTDKEAKFVSRGSGYTLYLAESEAVFSLTVPGSEPPNSSQETEEKGRKSRTGDQADVLRMQFAGANAKPAIEGDLEAVTKTNYYTGKKRFEKVPNFKSVNYKDLYNGIDAVFYGNENNQLEYDFVVAPNADANQISLEFKGAENVSVNEQGDLVIKTARTTLVQQKPYSYQELDGQKREVSSRYVITNETSVRFELGEYDHARQLVIDPRIGYSTYLGGTDIDEVSTIKADAAGNAYVVGFTRSTNFPAPGAPSISTGTAVFVSKISPDGQDLLYNTFLDGEENDGIHSFFDGSMGSDLELDAAGNVYITGTTQSNDFPITANAYQKTRLCKRVFGQCVIDEEAFVTKLNSVGGIVYSTFLGGRDFDECYGIAVDAAGRAYVTGMTGSGITFPKKNEFQGTGFFGASFDAFLTVFNADGSDIIYSTGFGGNGTDFSNDIALDSSNNVYIAGDSDSSDNTFPFKNAFQNSNQGGRDAFVAKFNTSLSGDASLTYSTLLGGSGTDEPRGIQVNATGQAHVTGLTGSLNFPLKNPIRSTNQINEAFVTVLNSTGNALVNSTFLGGSGQDFGNDIELDPLGNIYITGSTSSNDFPLAVPFQSTLAGGEDAFVTKLKFGTGIISSSYLGGSNFDTGLSITVQNGRVSFIAGKSASANLTTTPNVLQGTNANGDTDAFITRLLDSHIDSVGVFRPASSFLLTQSTTNVVSQTASFTANLAGQRGVSGDWDGDGIDTIGSFTNGVWKIRNSNFPLILAPPAITVNFGTTGDLPVAGDWNGDGVDTPGFFRPGTGQFTLTDSSATNPPITKVTIATFGTTGDLPISGDWDGDGKDSVAVYRPSTGETFFTDDDMEVQAGPPIILNPAISFVAFLGIAEDLPFAGDWNGDGLDSLGLWRPSTTEMILSDDNINLRAVFLFGQSTDQPIAGDWDGKPNP